MAEERFLHVAYSRFFPSTATTSKCAGPARLSILADVPLPPSSGTTRSWLAAKQRLRLEMIAPQIVLMSLPDHVEPVEFGDR